MFELIFYILGEGAAGGEQLMGGMLALSRLEGTLGVDLSEQPLRYVVTTQDAGHGHEVAAVLAETFPGRDVAWIEPRPSQG